jgi:hypothetical protein
VFVFWRGRKNASERPDSKKSENTGGRTATWRGLDADGLSGRHQTREGSERKSPDTALLTHTTPRRDAPPPHAMNVAHHGCVGVSPAPAIRALARALPLPYETPPLTGGGLPTAPFLSIASQQPEFSGVLFFLLTICECLLSPPPPFVRAGGWAVLLASCPAMTAGCSRREPLGHDGHPTLQARARCMMPKPRAVLAGG